MGGSNRRLSGGAAPRVRAGFGPTARRTTRCRWAKAEGAPSRAFECCLYIHIGWRAHRAQYQGWTFTSSYQRVAGSSPAGGSNKINVLAKSWPGLRYPCQHYVSTRTRLGEPSEGRDVSVSARKAWGDMARSVELAFAKTHRPEPSKTARSTKVFKVSRFVLPSPNIGDGACGESPHLIGVGAVRSRTRRG